VNNITGIFLGGRDITADATENISAFSGSESSRHFLFHFHHPDIPFCQIVIGRNPEIIHEPERFGLMNSETFGKIPWDGLLRSSPPAFFFFRRRIDRQSLIDDQVISGSGFPDDLRGKTALIRTDFPNLGIYLCQKIGEIFCPSLIILFTDKLQFSQMVGIAKSVSAGESEICFPMVTDSDTVKFRQDTGITETLPAALGMNMVTGKFGW